MTRFFPRLVAAFALSLLFGGVPASAQTVVRVASAQNSLGSLPVVIAEQKGLFAAQKLKIETIDFSGGAPAVQALASGSVDVCICAADHAVRLSNRGLGGKVLVALTDRHGYGLVALTTSPVTDLASLRGKRVGITSAGSLTDNTLRYFISELHLSADSDFELIAAGTGGSMLAAIQSGAVAAGMLTTPDVQAALAAQGRFKLVQDFRQLEYPSLDLLVTDRWLKADPEAARGFARAVVQAQHIVQTDPGAVKAAVDQMFPSLTPELRAVLASEAPRLQSPDGRLTKDGYALMSRMMQISDPSLKAVPYETITAFDFLPAP